MTARQLKARIVKKTPLHEGFLKVYKYQFEVEGHDSTTRQITWELMERGNSVAVLGHDPNRDEIVLGKEFRPGAMVTGDYPYLENLIAGVIENNESPIDAAVREMQEEAGLVLRNPVLIHPGAYVSSGGTSEKPRKRPLLAVKVSRPFSSLRTWLRPRTTTPLPSIEK